MKDILLEFLRFHYKENPLRSEETNIKDVEEFIEQMGDKVQNENCEHYNDCDSGYCLFCGELI